MKSDISIQCGTAGRRNRKTQVRGEGRRAYRQGAQGEGGGGGGKGEKGVRGKRGGFSTPTGLHRH